MYYGAPDEFATTYSGFITPILTAILIILVGALGRMIVNRQTNTDETVAKLVTEMAVQTQKSNDQGIINAQHTAGMAKLTESSIQLMTVVTEHIKQYDRDMNRIDERIYRGETRSNGA